MDKSLWFVNIFLACKIEKQTKQRQIWSNLPFYSIHAINYYSLYSYIINVLYSWHRGDFPRDFETTGDRNVS